MDAELYQLAAELGQRVFLGFQLRLDLGFLAVAQIEMGRDALGDGPAAEATASRSSGTGI